MNKAQLKNEQQDNKEFPNEFIFKKHKGRVIPPPHAKIEDVGEVIFCRDIMTAFVIVHKHK